MKRTLTHIAAAFKPNTAALGYALFLAVNATGVWGGVFPFLPISFQTPALLFWFFLAQSVVFSLCYFASAVGVYFLPGPTRRFLVPLASAPYLAGWCCLIAAIYVHAWSLPLVVAGGALLGLGSAGFFMLWQRLFSSFDAERGSHDLILGTAYGSLLYFSLYLIPQAVTAYLVPLVFMPLFGLAIVLKSREIDLAQPMFEDVPHENPQVYRRVVRDYWRSALCVGTLAFCAGIMRALAIGDAQVGPLVNALSMVGSLATAVGILVLWRIKGVQLNVVGAYRMVFPFVITSFLVLPFFIGEPAYERWQASLLYAAYSAAIVLMMIQCAQAARDGGINPVFVYGFFGGVVYALHGAGFMAGAFASQVRVAGMRPETVVALAAVYLLGLMFFIGQGGFRQALGTRRATSENIELQPESAEPLPKPQGEAATPEAPAPTAPRETALPDGLSYQDRISKQAQLVRLHYRLSARETEVMELIARGNTVARIAEELVVSENTIRTHSKRIYAKLDIHRKQELLDLVESFQP